VNWTAVGTTCPQRILFYAWKLHCHYMCDIVIMSLKDHFYLACWNKSAASCKEMNSQYLQSYEYAMYYVMLLEL